MTDAPRVLILSASIGEGHDLPARMIADGLRQERPGIHVRIEDGLLAMGWPIDRAVLGGARMESRAGELFFDALYWVYAQVGPTRRLGGWLLETLGGRRLLALIAAERPDIVVATYPGVSEALGRLRQHGRLDVPVASAITDLAGLRLLGAPGRRPAPRHPPRVDRGGAGHRAGQPHRVGQRHVVAGLPASRAIAATRAARSTSRPTARSIVVSGGGWAMGDLEGAAEAALRVDGATVVCLCGRMEDVRARLAARFAGESRLRALGFTEVMGDWLAAARRPHPLDRGPDGARGDHPRLPGHLLRLGARAHPRQQPRLPALRAGRGGARRARSSTPRCGERSPIARSRTSRSRRSRARPRRSWLRRSDERRDRRATRPAPPPRR